MDMHTPVNQLSNNRTYDLPKYKDQYGNDQHPTGMESGTTTTAEEKE